MTSHFKESATTLPMQPLALDDQGTMRFRPNAIVRYLIDQVGLNKLHAIDDQEFTQAEWEQLMQLIGYSLCGYHELSCVSDESALAASKAARAIEPETRGCRDDGCEWHVGVPRATHLPSWPTSMAETRHNARRKNADLGHKWSEQRRLVIDYINALGPHMEEAWKDKFVDVFGFKIDEGNPYRPVNP